MGLADRRRRSRQPRRPRAPRPLPAQGPGRARRDDPRDRGDPGVRPRPARARDRRPDPDRLHLRPLVGAQLGCHRRHAPRRPRHPGRGLRRRGRHREVVRREARLPDRPEPGDARVRRRVDRRRRAAGLHRDRQPLEVGRRREGRREDPARARGGVAHGRPHDPADRRRVRAPSRGDPRRDRDRRGRGDDRLPQAAAAADGAGRRLLARRREPSPASSSSASCPGSWSEWSSAWCCSSIGSTTRTSPDSVATASGPSSATSRSIRSSSKSPASWCYGSTPRCSSRTPMPSPTRSRTRSTQRGSARPVPSCSTSKPASRST